MFSFRYIQFHKIRLKIESESESWNYSETGKCTGGKWMDNPPVSQPAKNWLLMGSASCLISNLQQIRAFRFERLKPVQSQPHAAFRRHTRTRAEVLQPAFTANQVTAGHRNQPHKSHASFLRQNTTLRQCRKFFTLSFLPPSYFCLFCRLSSINGGLSSVISHPSTSLKYIP